MTDQQSLKYMLEENIGTPSQQTWITKVLGYDFFSGIKSQEGEQG